MSLFLILLAAGESKRLKSTVPKPFLKVNGKSLLELSYESFDSVNKIKKTVIVYNISFTGASCFKLKPFWQKGRKFC